MKLRDGEYVDEENVLSAEERAAVDALRNPSNVVYPPNGFMRFKNGDVYEGDFQIVEPNEDDYEDIFAQYLMDGDGKMWMVDGRLYIGQWRKDAKHGKGRFEREVGGEYIGDFAHDRMNGKGTYNLPDGTVYRGEFKNDMMHGYGEMFYLGNIHNYIMFSLLHLILVAHVINTTDGSVYRGQWRADHRDGKGYWRSPVGTVYMGGFHKGNMQGEGTIKHAQLFKDRVPRQTTSCGNITAQRNWCVIHLDKFTFPLALTYSSPPFFLLR